MPLSVPSYHLISLKFSGEALRTAVPMTTIVLEYSFGLGVITIHGNIEDVSLAPMTTPCVMDVNPPLLCLPLDPFCSNKTATVVWIKGSLVR